MKIIFAGTPQNAATVLRSLVQSGHEIVAVLTREDALVGRKRILTESAVAIVAHELGIQVIKATQVTGEIIAQIKATGAEFGLVVAYGSLLRQAALDSLPKGWANLHFSLLPDWRGAAPAQRAILNGDHISGVTLFQLDSGLDTGDIWGQVPVEIQQTENSGELIHRLTEIGISLINEQLPRIESGLFKPTPQVGSGRTASKLKRDEAELDFQRSAIELERAVRAFNPEPIAFTMAGDDQFRILRASAVGISDANALAQDFEIEPGRIVIRKNRVWVGCNAGTLLELQEVQPAGKKPMSAIDWTRGKKVERLG